MDPLMSGRAFSIRGQHIFRDETHTLMPRMCFPTHGLLHQSQTYQGRTLELLAAVQRVAIFEQADVVLQGTWQEKNN